MAKYENRMHLEDRDGIIILDIMGNLILTKDRTTYTLNPSEYTKYIKSNKIMPRFRLLLLNSDETIREDISEYIIEGSGSLSINYQQGQRRGLNISLINTDGRWTPNANHGNIWINTMFRFDLGINFQGEDFWYPQGIFVQNNPKVYGGTSNKKIDLQLVDKFANITGYRGNIINTYKIPVSSSLFSGVNSLITLPKTNGDPVDFKPLIFDDTLTGVRTPYTLNKNPNESIGDIIIDLANFSSCDCFYNTSGNLVFQSGIEDLSLITKPIIWSFDTNEMEYSEPNMLYDMENVVNIVRVVGANINGALVDYKAINTNTASSVNINYGDRSKEIEDNFINTVERAKDRAEWELNKHTILSVQGEIKSSFIPTLDVNNIIEVTDEQYRFFKEKFVIQSLNIPISVDSQISISCSNIKDLPYYYI